MEFSKLLKFKLFLCSTNRIINNIVLESKTTESDLYDHKHFI